MVAPSEVDETEEIEEPTVPEHKEPPIKPIPSSKEMLFKPSKEEFKKVQREEPKVEEEFKKVRKFKPMPEGFD